LSGTNGALQVHEREQAVVLTVTADAALATLWKSLEPFIDAGKKAFVLDLAEMKYLNSTSIAAILTARNKAAAHGCRLLVANLGDGIRSVFRILKLERLFDLELTLERALQTLR
jgi:anti-anti-sigma factor